MSKELSDEPWIEEGDVSDPDHAKDQGQHEEQEVGAGRRITGSHARQVDLDIREFVLQNAGEVPQGLVDLRRTLEGHRLLHDDQGDQGVRGGDQGEGMVDGDLCDGGGVLVAVAAAVTWQEMCPNYG